MKGIRSLAFSVTLLFTNLVLALGLGEITINSSLNEPLDGAVALVNIGDLDREEMLVGLASQKDFDRAGVDREFHLLDFRFKVDLSDQSRPIILIKSSKPIREPYLNFLVELQWPAGRLLREYTVFLDPPIFSDGPLSSKPKLSVATTKNTSSDTQARPSSDSGNAGVVSGASVDYLVRGGDTLWGIARKFRGQDSSMQQAMLAIFEQNSKAFINGDMNLLRKGALLMLPDSDGIRKVDPLLADRRFAESAEQYQRSAGTELIADNSEEQATEVTTEPSGILRLSLTDDSEPGVSAEDGQQSDSTGQTGPDPANELAMAQEELARSTRENLELKEKLAQMEEQLATISRMVELGDSELRALQDGASGPDSITEAEQEPEVATDGIDAGVVVTTEPADTGLIAVLKNNLAIIAAALLLVVLGVLFLLARARKESAENVIFPAGLEAEAPSAPTAGAVASEVEEVPQSTVDVEREQQESPEIDLDTSLILAPDEKVDPVSEADIYLSVGDFGEAETVINRALENDANNSRLHLKLLSVYTEQGNATAFYKHYPNVVALGDPATTESANKMRGTLPDLLDVPVPAMSTDEPEVAEELSDYLLAPDEDFDLDIASSDEGEVEPEAISLEDEQGSLSEIELDLDLDTDLDQEEELVIDTGQGDVDLESLDIDDFDIDEDLELLVEGDQIGTQLELAQAYIDMGDKAGARDILSEVVENGDADQKAEAEKIIKQIS